MGIVHAFEGVVESNPPNVVLTITERDATQEPEESMVSIPVMITSHTYEHEADRMEFTYAILGDATARQSAALQCQQCLVSIFVDNLFTLDPFDPGTCCGEA